MNAIIDYYEEIKNNVDITAETLLCQNLNESEYLEISSTRRNILEKVDEIIFQNLKFLKLNKINQNHCEYFGPKFIFILNRRDQHFGQIVIANKYVSKIVRDILNNLPNKKEPTFKDELENVIIKTLTKANWKSEIADLTKIENNVIDTLKLCIIKPLKRDDFKILESWINLDKLVSLTIEIDGKIPNESFLALKCLKKLKIIATSNTAFEEKCFFGLDKLDLLTFSRLLDNSFNQSINYLSNLKKLNFFDCDLGLLNVKNLNNLDCLHINNCYVNFSNLIELANLTSLTSINCALILLNELNSFKNLIFLNIQNCTIDGYFHTKSINTLRNLEILYYCRAKNSHYIDYEELDLPKLKYLAITSEIIPIFKKLELNYLCIKSLKHFDQSRLASQKELMALSIAINNALYEKIDENYFAHLNNLVFLDIKVWDYFDLGPIEISPNLSKVFEKKFESYHLNTDFNSVQMSIHKNFHELVEKQLSLSKEAKDILCYNIPGSNYSDKQLGIKSLKS